MSRTDITILYVDDEEINLFLFQHQFKAKYNVLVASSPLQGLEILQNNSDDIIVVISDMRMPKMNGLEFISQAKEKYNKLFYFILTAFDYDDDINAALEEKLIHKFFSKPFDFDEIDKAIQDLV